MPHRVKRKRAVTTEDGTPAGMEVRWIYSPHQLDQLTQQHSRLERGSFPVSSAYCARVYSSSYPS
jgi:hypothetical protein